ncbi:MAG TPA: helix-turn-helix domain-containing protein [Clostridiales bacterium]|nr:helix-turn-helix domain-containing protein [Clostridiales bacterium]HQP70424.1 helix-turn-helix domain-containing protein [Clostridiales bacterium]
MRKSVEEKLKVIKQATSRKKIKKLAEIHGITPRTIRNWINSQKNGLLSKNKSQKKKEDGNDNYKANGSPLSELVLKVSELYPLQKEKPVFRYLIKDINHGFVFCAYSPVKEKRILSQFIAQFISDCKRSGIRIKRLFIDKSCEIFDVDRSRYKDIEFILKHYKEIRKYVNFSLKKYNYLKERTRYENICDFLFDSLATVSLNNQIILERSALKSNKFKSFIKKVNMTMHSDIVYDCGNFFDTEKTISDLKAKYSAAVQHRKNKNHETSDNICEKLIHILEGSGSDDELLINAIIKRSKISIIRSNSETTKYLLKSALLRIRSLPADRQNLYRYQIYMLYSDCHRIIKDSKNSIYHLNKAHSIVSSLNDEKALALFYLNCGLIVKELYNTEKAVECYKKSIELAQKNGYHEIKAQADQMIRQISTPSLVYPEHRHQFI